VSDETGKWAPRWAGLVVAVVIVASIGGPLIGRGTFLAVDQLRLREPWSADTPSSWIYRLPFSTDVIDSGTPARHAIREALVEDRRLPHWNPYPNGGTPLGSTPSSGIFNPIVWPEILLGVELGAAWAGLLRMVVAAVGMFLLLRRLRTGSFAAVCGGLVYCTSGFVVGWTNWPQADIAALIPLAFLTADAARERRRAIDVVALALVVAAMLLSGYPPLVIVVFIALAVFLVVRWWEESRTAGPEPPPFASRIRSAVRPAGLLVAAVAIGAALVAFQLVPFVDSLDAYDLSYRERNTDRLPPAASLLTSVFPWALGGPEDSRSFSFAAVDAASGTDFVEQFAFLGAAAFVFAIWAAIRGRPRRVSAGVYRYCIAGIVVVAVGLFTTSIAGVPVGRALRNLIYLVPGVEQVPLPRFVAVMLFLASLLAAFGIEQVVDPTPRRTDRRFLWRVLAVAGVGAVLGFTAVRSWFRSTVDLVGATGFSQRAWILEHALLPAVLVLATVVLIIVVGRTRGAARTIAIGAIPVLLAAEGLMVTVDMWPRVPRSDYYFSTPTTEYLQDRVGHERIAAAETTLMYATNPVYGLRSVGGHSFFTSRWADLVDAAGTTDYQPTQLRLAGDKVEVATSPILDRLGARYFVASAVSSPFRFLTWPGSAPFGEVTPAPPAAGTVTVGTGEPGHATLPGGPLRGVSVTLVRPVVLRGDLVRLRVAVRDGDGRVVARGIRRIYDRLPGRPGPPAAVVRRGAVYWVPVAGERQRDDGPVTVEVTLQSDDPRDAVRVEATRDGDVSMGYVRPRRDGLDLTYADAGTTIYERTTALPRIRWASRAKVIPNGGKRVAALAAGTVPRDTVVLDRRGPVARGAPASLGIRRDTNDEVRADVDADGAGYLVVADALQDGWSATVDGHSVPLVNADHAVVAVPVPEGEHVVRLRADPGGWRSGVVVSLAALVLVLGVLVFWLVRRR
jgi:hypothetical protein